MPALLTLLLLLALTAPAGAAWTPPVRGPAGGAAPRPAASGPVWTLPVRGRVTGRFAVGTHRFAPGQRRGVDLAATPGAPVVAPCAGRVAWVGDVPRFGTGASLLCGTLTATVLGLRRAQIRTGAVVRRGATIGTATKRIRLGARVTTDPFGYRDPLTLIGEAEPHGRPLIGPRGERRPSVPAAGPRPATAPRDGAAPLRAATLRDGAAPLPAAAPRDRAAPLRAATPRLGAEPLPAARPLSAAVRSPASIPLPVWVGAALIALALPSGALARRARRPRVHAARWSVGAPK
jgi:hypothetical protein